MASSSVKTDVVVIGAGPAGSRTAEMVARQGHDVLQLERDPAPGRPVHCSGIVSQECFERYDLPRSLVRREIRSFVLRAPSGRPTGIRKQQNQALVLDRVALDCLLAERARAAGATLWTDAQAQDVTWTGQSVRVSATVAGALMTIEARVAVVATGFGAPLARKLGMTGSTEVISGCQVVAEASNVDEVEVFTGGAFGDGGFGWLVPREPGFALAGLLTRRGTATILAGYIERLQAEGRIGRVVEEYRCRGIPVGPSNWSVRDGILGVGDVVSQVKPTSGGGIYYGLLSADAAAQTIVEALAREDVTARGLAPYQARWKEMLDSEIRQGILLRGILEQLPDGMIEQFHRLLSVPGMKRLLLTPSFDWHSGPLSKVLRLLQRRAKAPEPVAR